MELHRWERKMLGDFASQIRKAHIKHKFT